MTTEQTIARFERLLKAEQNVHIREIGYRMGNDSLAKAIIFLELAARVSYGGEPSDTPQPSPRPVHKPNPLCFGFKPFGILFRR